MATLQKYLRDNKDRKSLSEICKKFHIKYNKHELYPNLLLFKYTDIMVSFDNPITRESRGLILDSSDDWNIVAYPYDKFFNHGEKNAATLDWSTARIYEKLDGCLMTVYYYDNKWLVSSSGKPDAAGATSKEPSVTLGQEFWRVWNSINYELPANTEICYIFELLTDRNPVKVMYPNNDIILHGARNVKTLQELDPVLIANETGWKCIQIHDINKDSASVIEFVNSRSGFEYEGVVACDSNFNRLKIKSHAYISIFYSIACINSRPEASRKRLFELIISGNNDDLSELCNAFPKLKDMATEIEKEINELCRSINEEYDSIKELGTQKRFAEEAKKSKYTSCLFMLRSKKAKNAQQCLAKSGYEYFDKLTIREDTNC